MVGLLSGERRRKRADRRASWIWNELCVCVLGKGWSAKMVVSEKPTLRRRKKEGLAQRVTSFGDNITHWDNVYFFWKNDVEKFIWAEIPIQNIIHNAEMKIIFNNVEIYGPPTERERTVFS